MSYYDEQQIRLQFLDEVEEYLNILESGLLGIASQPLEKERLEEMRRACHSIKGGAGLMNYQTLSDLVHSLEDIFNSLSPGYICDRLETEQTFLHCIDCLKDCISRYRQGNETIPEDWLNEQVNPLFTQLTAEFEHLSPNLPSFSEDIDQADITIMMFETEVAICLERLETLLNSPDQAYLREEFNLAAQELEGLGQMLRLPNFQSLCVEIKAAIDQATTENLAQIAQLALENWKSAQNLVLEQQSSLIPSSFTFPDVIQTQLVNTTFVITTETIKDYNLRVSAEKLAQIEDLFGELIIEKNGLNLQLKQLANLIQLLRERVNTLDKANHSLRNIYDQTTQSTTPKSLNNSLDILELDRYTEIHPFFQDLMEVILEIKEVTEDLELNLDLTQKTAKGCFRTSQLLQNNLTQVRLRPFADLVKVFPRAIRDMTIKYGKQVNFQVKGESTLIDRTILDVLSDPLIHLVRNAFDHGIEDPETRLALGKSPEGNIVIETTQKGNLIVITVQDDGKGIDLDRIRQKASNSIPQNLSQKKLLDLIFEPGFSTASQVTELSGRGLGMDIVQRELQKIRGQIQVNTESGKGTTFTITVPLTLSIVRVLLVESGKMLMAIPLNIVEEMLIINPDLKIESAGQNLLDWDGEIIPLLNLSPWLNFSRLSPQTPQDQQPIIDLPIVLIIAQGNRLFGLEMDRYWGEQEVTIRNLEGVLPLPTGLIGCTILSDGRVVPLADPLALINWIEQNHCGDLTINSPWLSNSEIISPIETKTIMVVDDSINFRRFLALTLAKVGYNVEQAKDGQEALEKLSNTHIDLVICDLEMPRLDGYGFLTQVRSKSQYQSLPVIMLTSRSGEKHRQMAMNLGANVYFSKPFQEQLLLNTLKSLLT